MGLLGDILPPTVAWAERFDDADPVAPFPEEEAAVAAAGVERRRSFRTVRHCARLAMADLGRPPAPVTPGASRAPCWPEGLVGSMTHCAGYRGAALGPASALLSIGIDAEPHRPVPERLAQAVSLLEERAALARLTAVYPHIHAERLLFSAKEAVYKAWFPLTRSWLGFDEATVSFLPDGRFTARLLPPGPVVDGSRLTAFPGRWLVRHGLVLTAIVLERPPADHAPRVPTEHIGRGP
ncbi:4'-phosphopantetheinyl transferase [Streptomyces sp. AK010]|uniref:4'-phosphopantetheinyl transferase family protein n=1 Tax=Streptomyces sp. AK010 TaxID=2723074 RepID=UPI001851D8D5|nr:4'-phosphopantetheinyl transferase superfamily protein [Streptomyces sp. AK010]MBB6421403.1 4'-phosphopantetheinyl transferase EntD [Streptomyces sp. AK010]